ncbi:Uncharacterised protein [Mycobacteroides abscessus subsp. massiliense]|nr:Uncharacterised protein [Mycobacteroides abscessus subsp. massiliense]SKH39726.1 Uncharacterised protein [Mycobacteroides abscessus subsp. massiliense]SKH90171.1 Uncharacterised protein [Mycobacteroides abscessus subsp. massiliense]SKK83656.1 Uncharacterised protein [Mycobacteroides abscessus subsp. massiliense]SKK90094.1 Uncharacterised protein [Mycobacteroides abscessus subsp. massiliense]
MCRYRLNRCKTHYVCIKHRHVAKSYNQTLCPTCREPMWLAGHDFHAPKKRNDSGWDAVQHVKDSGQNYDSCGCGGPGWRPITKAEVRRTKA